MALPSIRDFYIKVIFLIHVVAIAIISMGYWNSGSFLFYNGLFIVFLIWSIYVPNEETLRMTILMNVVSVFLDILLLILSYPTNDYRAKEQFSAAICILHLLFRPFSIFVLVKSLEERTGAPGTISGFFGGPPEQTSYEDIDERPPHPSSYDFSNAQQI